MAEGQPEAQVTPLAHPKPTAEAGPETVDAAANLATLAAVKESVAESDRIKEFEAVIGFEKTAF